MPKELRECYRANPIEIIQLLADIIRGGAPKDAILAGAYVESNSYNPVAGTLMSAFSPEHVDRTGEDAPRALRPALLEAAAKHLRALDKGTKPKSGK